MIDQFDRAILAILQKDNATPLREISAKVNLSAPAVQRRIKRLEEAGTICANTAVLDPSHVGRPITIIAEVSLVSETAALIDDAKKGFAEIPEVQQCYYITGDSDFVLVITATSMADYEALTRRIFFANNNVKRFRTSVVMDRVKAGLDYPL